MNYRELLKNNPGALVEKLVTDLKNQKSADVRFEFEDDEQWSVVTTHIDDEDAEISLRLHTADRYDLYFGYYDADDEFQELTHPLTAEQQNTIPKALQKIMQKVLSDEQGMRVPGNLLSK